MSKKIILSIIFVLSITILFGQKIEPYQELVKEFKNKELVILVLEENEEITARYKKPENVEFHKKAIKNYNSIIKEYATIYITSFKNVKFKTINEIKEWSQEERQKYYYLCYNIADRETNITIGSVDPGERASAISSNFYGEIEPGEEDKFLYRYKNLPIRDLGPNYGRLEICGLPIQKSSKKMKPEKLKKFQSYSRSVWVRNLPSRIVEKWSVIFALRSFESSFNTIESGKKPWDYKDLSAAKGKTILLCEDDLHKNLDADKLKAICAAKYEVVSRTDLTMKIEEKAEGYVYILPIPSRVSVKASGGGASMSGINYIAELIDCESGKTVTTMNSREKLRLQVLKVFCDRVGR